MVWINLQFPEYKLIQVRIRNRKAPSICVDVTGKLIDGDLYPEDGGVCSFHHWNFESYRSFVDIPEGEE